MSKAHWLRVLIVAVLLATFASPSMALASTSTTVVKLWVGNNIMTIGSVRQPIDSEGTKPVIVEGRTLVPIRAVIEAFDGSVAWEASTRKVTVSLGENVLDLWIGKSTASLNGTTLPVDAANPRVIPVIMSGRTMLPLRFVSESLGIDVQYEATTKMITLTYTVDTTLPPPSAPMLVSPSDGTAIVEETPTFSWFPVTGTDMARIQILSAGTEVYAKSDLSGTEYAVPPGVLPDGTYTWRVALHNEGGWGTWSGFRTFTLSSATPPSAPQLLAPVNGSAIDSANVVLTWQSVAGADSYRIQISQNAGEAHAASSLTGTAYTVPAGVLASGTYSWQAAAHSSGGWSPWSDAVSFQVRTKLTTADIAKYVDRMVLIEVNGFEDGEAFSASGSGFFISSDGKIVTNYHVIDAATEGTVTLNGGHKYDVASVLGYDKDQDLAVIRISGTGFPICTLGDSSKVAVGDPVVAIGSPLGIQNTVSEGIVSKLWEDGSLQITAPISPGSSGGALFNMYGEVIGVTTWKIRNGENMNLAVPVNLLQSLDTTSNLTLAQLYQREHGAVPAVPSPPVLLQPSNGTSLNPYQGELSWNASAGADSYTVWIGSGAAPTEDTEVLHKTVTTTTFKWSGSTSANLNADSTYCWQVAAHNSFGWSDWSEVRVFRTIPRLSNPILYSPADGTTVSLMPTLSWSSVPNGVSYMVWVGKGSVDDNNPIVWVSPSISGTSVTIPSGKLVPGTTYWWKILCTADSVHFAGTSISDARRFQTAGVTLTPPSLLQPTEGYEVWPILDGYQVKFGWSGIAGATSYQVWIGSGLSGDESTNLFKYSTSSTSYTVSTTTLASGRLYTWAIAAVDGNGNHVWSNDGHFTVVDTSGITTVYPTNYSIITTNPTLRWSPYGGATSYRVILKQGTTYSSSTGILDQIVYSAQYTLPGNTLTHGLPYVWFVSAYSGDYVIAVSNWSYFSVSP